MKSKTIALFILLTILILIPFGKALHAAPPTQSQINLNNSSVTTQVANNIDFDFSIYMPIILQGSFSITSPTTMVRIHSGQFEMGCDQDKSYESCSGNELPLHQVNLDSFYIDLHEVTNGQYAQCVEDWFCDPPDSSSSRTRSSYYDNPTYANYPVIYVSWYDANDYCTWVGKRLPTEAEWEKVSRGTLYNRMYPWGNEKPNCALTNFRDESGNCIGDTTQVGSYFMGASPYGVLDMAGNVMEWVADWYRSDYYDSFPVDSWPPNPTGPTLGSYMVVRGGGFADFWGEVRTANRDIAIPSTRNLDYLGFRCASSIWD